MDIENVNQGMLWSHFSDDNTQVIFVHQLMTFAAKVPRQQFAAKVPTPIVTNRLIQ